jgi:hypothetical protein
MNTHELQYILDKSFILRTLHGEVCPKDHLPKRKPCHVKAYIVNTHNSDQPGEHWVAIYFKENTALYFDSYGLPPFEEDIQLFLDNNSRSWSRNKIRLQSGSSAMCGVYCLFALDALARGCDLETILTIQFRLEPRYWHLNDKDVGSWFKQLYGHLYAKARLLAKPEHCQCCIGDQSDTLALALFNMYVLDHDYLYP